MTTTQRAGARRSAAPTNEPAAVLVADCPWLHNDKLGQRGATAKYDCMATADICKLELPPRAERSALILWRLANMPQDALDVCRAWGFEAVSEIVWEKMRPCQTCAATGRVDVYRIGGEQVIVPGEDNTCPACHGRLGLELTDVELGAEPAWLGMGTTVRNAHETAIIARPINGRAPERLHLDVRSYFAAPMLIDVDGVLPESNGRRGALVHSAKPDAFFARVERLYPGPYVEMFSRRTREGWSSAYSNQDDKLDEVARVMREDWPRRVREELLAKAKRKAARPAALDTRMGCVEKAIDRRRPAT